MVIKGASLLKLQQRSQSKPQLCQTGYIRPFCNVGLKVFEKMVHNNYDTLALQVDESISCDVSQEEVDIVEYIGGFVIHSLKKKANKTADTDEKAHMLLCLSRLTLSSDRVSDSVTSTASTSVSARKSLTQVLDRGGLTQIKPNVVQMFVELESIFRKCFTGEKQFLSSDLYISKCSQILSPLACTKNCTVCMHQYRQRKTSYKQ